MDPQQRRQKTLEALTAQVEACRDPTGLEALASIRHGSGVPHVAALAINRLAQREINAVIDGVVGNKLISASARCCASRRDDQGRNDQLVYNINRLIFLRNIATA
jgi:hypothetical protein